MTNVDKLFGVFAAPNRSVYSFSGYANELHNPNTDVHDKLRTIELLNRLKFDPHISSCIQSRASAALAMDWEIQYESDKTPEIEFIENVIKSLDMKRIITEMLEAPLDGYKPLEVYWDFDDNGYLVPKDIIGKPAWWFFFDSNNMLWFKDRETLEDRLTPRMKFLLLQNNPKYDNPYGESVLAKCYLYMAFKAGGFELWSKFIRKYGMPFLHGILNTGKEDDLNELTKQLYALQEDGVIGSMDGVEIKTIESNGGNSDDYLKFIHFCNSEISKAILSQTLTTEQGDTGSYAMSQTHLQVREDVVKADVEIVCNAFNELLKWICELNFPEMVSTPKFMMFADLGVDLELAQRDQIIFQGGYCKPTLKYLTRAYNYKADDLIMVEQPAEGGEGALPPSAAPEQMPLEQPITEEPLQDGGMFPPAEPMAYAEPETNADVAKLSKRSAEVIDKVIDMIKEQKSFEEVQDTITKAFSEIDTDQLTELIGQGILAAGNQGRKKGSKFAERVKSWLGF